MGQSSATATSGGGAQRPLPPQHPPGMNGVPAPGAGGMRAEAYEQQQQHSAWQHHQQQQQQQQQQHLHHHQMQMQVHKLHLM
jgi:hypothetical protein